MPANVWPIDELCIENMGAKEVSHFALMGTKTREICIHEKDIDFWRPNQ